MRIQTVLDQGYEVLAAQRAAKEQFPDALRVGTVGCVTPEGVYGTCHRIAMARLLGYEMEPTRDARIMWAAGDRNEDTWKEILVAGGLRLLEDVSIHTLVGTRSVVGHPDIVAYDPQTGARFGLELKGIFGMSTLASVLKDKPKNENLIQAATYAMFLNIPFKLCYTLYHWSNVGGRQIRPFHKVFDLQWFGDWLKYRPEDAEEWISTSVTQTGIRAYYTQVSNQEMGDRPLADYVDGTPKRNGDTCQYCEFAMACDRYDTDRDFDHWKDMLSQLTEIVNN